MYCSMPGFPVLHSLPEFAQTHLHWVFDILVFYIHSFSMTTFHLLCCCSVALWCPAFCGTMDCSMPGFPVLHHLLGLLQTHVLESVMPSNHLILCWWRFTLFSIYLESHVNLPLKNSSQYILKNLKDGKLLLLLRHLLNGNHVICDCDPPSWVYDLY